MKTINPGKILIIFVMILMFAPCSSLLGQGSNSEGYGSYDKMGQDPDQILEYGRGMMRYGFHDGTTSGGSNKYPGYNSDLNEETVKKLNAEQEAFLKMTEGLRQTIYEKELYLKVEISKKNPDKATALGFQKELSEARGKFEQKMIEHLIRMKKINLDAKSGR
jgi:hypothetical protein